jgi:hypothetical protein
MIANQKMKRLSAHTDFDSFTLLFQDDCGGLEVQKSGRPGEFIHAEPIKNALVMNIGDVLMRGSNGEFLFDAFWGLRFIPFSILSYFDHPSCPSPSLARSIYGRRANDKRTILNSLLCKPKGRHIDGISSGLSQ